MDATREDVAEARVQRMLAGRYNILLAPGTPETLLQRLYQAMQPTTPPDDDVERRVRRVTGE